MCVLGHRKKRRSIKEVVNKANFDIGVSKGMIIVTSVWVHGLRTRCFCHCEVGQVILW